MKKYPSESNYVYAGNSPIYMVDRDGKKKTTFIIIVDDRTGKTSISQTQSSELHKVTREISNTIFGISTHDYHHEYDWYDITTIQVTHIDKNGNSTTSSTTNNQAKFRSNTNFDWGQGYVNAKLDLEDKMKPVKENSTEDGYVMTSKNGGHSESSFNKSSKTISGVIDVDLLLNTLSAANSAAKSGPLELDDFGKTLVGTMKPIAETISRLIESHEMGDHLREAFDDVFGKVNPPDTLLCPCGEKIPMNQNPSSYHRGETEGYDTIKAKTK